MKTSLIAILSLFLFAAGANAQQTETLFSSDISHGGFGALVFGATSVNGQIAYFRGTRGAWVINLSDEHSINLGLAGYRTGNEFDPSNWTVPGVNEPEMRTNYSGFEIEYVNRTHRLFHYSIQTLIGSGNVRYDRIDFGPDRRSDNYFVLQPGVNLNLNITNWFRLSGGFHYRYTGGVNLEGTSNSDLSGFATFFTLRFGKF